MRRSELLRRANLDDLLGEFKHAMTRKFWDRHERAIRRWGRSVVEDDFDWASLSHQAIHGHLQEEIAEWVEAEVSGSGAGDEAVDLANMAFLDWVYHHIVEAEE